MTQTNRFQIESEVRMKECIAVNSSSVHRNVAITAARRMQIAALAVEVAALGRSRFSLELFCAATAE